MDREMASNTSGQVSASPKYAMLLKVSFDFLYYFSVFSMAVGMLLFVLVGVNIPADVNERHTDIHYWFNVEVMPQSQASNTDSAPVSEIIRADGKVKLNNTRGYAAWFIANIELFVQGVVSLLVLFNLRKLFANLTAHRVFEIGNVNYIRRLGIIALAYSVTVPIITYLCGMAILADIGEFHEQLQLSPYFSLPVEGLLMGGALLVLVLAAARRPWDGARRRCGKGERRIRPRPCVCGRGGSVSGAGYRRRRSTGRAPHCTAGR